MFNNDNKTKTLNNITIYTITENFKGKINTTWSDTEREYKVFEKNMIRN